MLFISFEAGFFTSRIFPYYRRFFLTFDYNEQSAQAPNFSYGVSGKNLANVVDIATIGIELVLWLWYNNSMRCKRNNNVVYSCKYHVVWCPKYRRSVLTGEVAARLEVLIRNTADEINAEIFEMEIMPDHVHLLIEIDPQYGINKAVRHIKGVSSHVLRMEFPFLKSRLPTLWTTSYFVSTVGGAPLAVIKQYIRDQKNV